jgi:hypothetical protein
MRRRRKDRVERLLEAGGLLVFGFVALLALLFVIGFVEAMFANGLNLVVGLVVIGGVVAVLKYLPGCVEKIHAVRDRRKSKASEETTAVKVLGFTADEPPTRALGKTDARRGP